ncbi:MAG: tryptophan-rich sensory protein [Gemmataceae bacterium]|nr:tryptophan-rich sensory protein [Gemmataceae bacterium]
MLTLFSRRNRFTTALCLLGAVAALFLAQLPNDVRSEWFRSLARPDVLPRELERKIGFIWTALFLLTGLGTAAALASDRQRMWKGGVIALTLTCLALNLTYTFTFTRLHDLTTATWVAGGLFGVIAVLILIASIGRLWLTAVCQLPHFVWVGFATFVTARMSQLNG